MRELLQSRTALFHYKVRKCYYKASQSLLHNEVDITRSSNFIIKQVSNSTLNHAWGRPKNIIRRKTPRIIVITRKRKVRGSF